MKLPIHYILMIFSLLALPLKASEVDFNFKNSNSELNTLSSVTTYLKEIKPELEFTVISERVDELGFKHIKCQQTYKGHPVFGGEFILHFNTTHLYWINGTYHKIPGIQNTVRISSKENLNYAIEHAFSEEYKWECDPNFDLAEPEIWIFNTNGKDYRYTYKTDIYSVRPLFRHDDYIDAETGRSLQKIDKIHHIDIPAQGVTNYHGIQSFTVDSTPAAVITLKNTIGGGIHTVNMNGSYNFEGEFTDLNSFWSSPFEDERAGVEVHWGVERSYDYFSTKHNHHSIDNNNAHIKARVNYGGYYDNAFWDGAHLTFGGGGSLFNSVTSIDIVGHEFGHGVTQHTAGLIYYNESGALNESFSDIFGYCIHHFADSATASYRVGSLITIDTTSALRNMSNPNEFNHPDTYEGSYWYTGSADNGGVHRNSGVQNFWFYLLVNGGSGTNDNGVAYSVDGIGLEKASKIAFRNLNTYLTSYSNYHSARSGAIQAAKDLYGGCSVEAINVTNAWNAVGVGNSYSSIVDANFYSAVTSSCVYPFTTQFINFSTNNATNFWDFGDGNTSTEFNPIHTYDTTGIYTVKLIVTGSALCGNVSDTLEFVDYIEVGENYNLTPPSCNSNFVYDSDYRITSLTIDTFQHNPNIPQSLVDYTCIGDINLQVGKKIVVDHFEAGNNTKLRLYIDYDNSGSFTEDERIYYGFSPYTYPYHDTIILSASNFVFDTDLRMRAVYTDQDLEESCLPNLTGGLPPYGQQLDYRVRLLENNQAPIADFIVYDDDPNYDHPFSVGDTVQFMDFSENLPDSFYWEFEGGIPATSTLRNPKVTYSVPGFYDVKLTALNSHGEDSIVKVEEVEIIHEVRMCEESSSNTISGTFYDSGGMYDHYQLNEDCSFLINPGCAETITLSFTNFKTRYNKDIIRIYDGVDETGVLLSQHSGSSLPGAVTAYSGSMYITFKSSFYNTSSYLGWQANWYSTIPDTLPLANFTTSDTIFPLDFPVEFTNTSSQDIQTATWDFGDGIISHDINPVHHYLSSGYKDVTLSIFNCYGYDTISKTIFIQNSPQIQLIQDTVQVNMSCATDTTVQFSLTNLDGGDLYFNYHDNNTNADTLDILFMSVNANANETVKAKELLTTRLDLVRFTDSESSEVEDLELELATTDVVIIPPNYMYSSTINNLNPELHEFVENGGTVIFMANDGNKIEQYNFLETSDSYLNQNSVDPNVEVIDHPIVSDYILEWSDTIGFRINQTFTTPEYQPILIGSIPEFAAQDILGYMPKGEGEIIYFGLLLGSNTTTFGEDLFVKSIEYLKDRYISPLIDVNEQPQILVAGDTVELNVDITSQQLYAGTYLDSVQIFSNDSVNPLLNVYFNVVIEDVYDLVTVDELQFNTIYQYQSDTIEFTLENLACLDIVFDSIGIDNSHFAIADGVDTLLGYSQETIELVYSSEISESIQDTLRLYYDGNIKYIVLNAETLPSAVFQVSPLNIVDSVMQCGDSVLTSFTVYNLGELPLTGSIHREDAFSETSGLSFVDHFEGNGLDYWTQSTANGFNLGFNTTTNNHYLSFPNTASNLLHITRPFENNNPEYISFKIKAGYSQNTGSKIRIGSGGNNPIAGICEIQITNYYSRFNYGDGTYSQLSASSSYFKQVEFKNIDYTTKTFDLYFNGNMVREDAPFFNGSAINNQVAFTCGTSGNVNNGLVQIDDVVVGDLFTAPWMSSENALLVNPGDSQQVDLMLYSEGLNTGWYQGYVNFLTNANGGVDTIDVDFKVNGEEIIGIPLDLLEFPTTQQFIQSTDSFKVVNDGCGDLIITSTSNSISEFASSFVPTIVSPGDSTWVTVTFSPLTIGDFTDTLLLFSENDSNAIVLQGVSEGLAILELTETNTILNVSECEGALPVEFGVKNNGTVLLEYDVQRIESYIDEFESLNLNSFWQESQGVDVSQECGGQSWNKALIFNGGSIRYIETKSLYLSNQSSFAFNLRKAYQTNCNPPSGSARMKVMASVDNGLNWSEIQSFSPNGSYYNTFRTITVPLTSNLLNTEVKFRIEQSNHDGLDQDIWIVDNFNLGNYYYDLGNNALTPGDSTSLQTYLNYEEFSNGLNVVEYTLVSNDPINPIQVFTCSLYVNATPCTTLDYEFTTSCGGEVSFTTHTRNNVDNWYWEFGDGTTGFQSDPKHTYEETGLYNVITYACNANGCDTIYSTVGVTEVYGAKAPECIPTGTYVSSNDILSFKLGDIDNQTSYTSHVYEDFSCTDTTTLYKNLDYTVEIVAAKFTNKQISIWIDTDNNGEFELSERIYRVDQVGSPHTGILTVPSTGFMNTPLRMRVHVDKGSSSLVSSCSGFEGQFEDYTVYIRESDQLPVADFNFEEIDSCEGVFKFNNLSSLNPTSYLWNFGDGQTSTEENPIHDFAENTLYTVSLTVENINGSHTFSQSVTPSIPSSEVYVEVSGLQLTEPITFSIDSNIYTHAEWDFNNGTIYSGLSVDVGFPLPDYYPYTVTLTHNLGCEIAYSDTLDLVILQGEELAFYPNPSIGVITVESSIKSYTIFDGVGHEVLSYQGEEFASYRVIDLTQFADGQYIIKTKLENGQETYGRITIIR